jgi:predicted enzyme related to lactoylglutathione lyase
MVRDLRARHGARQKILRGRLANQAGKVEQPGIRDVGFSMAKDGIGASGALVKMPGVPSGGNSTLVYFSCVDCAIEAARVVKAGGRIQREKFSIGQYGFIALAIDTEGNMFGLHSMQ